MKDIKVIDMTCMSCVKKIQTALLKNGINAKFDVIKQIVSVKLAEETKAITIIQEVGYTPET